MLNQIETKLKNLFLTIKEFVRSYPVFTFIVILSAYILIPIFLKLPENHQSLGTLGDFFGGLLNPIIAAFALYFLIKSFNMQKAELKDVKAQIDRQNFENLFFQLLNTKNKVLEDLQVDSSLKNLVSECSINTIFKEDINKLGQLTQKLEELKVEQKSHRYICEDWLNRSQIEIVEGITKVSKGNLDEYLRIYSHKYDYLREFDTDRLEIITKKQPTSEIDFYKVPDKFFIGISEIGRCVKEQTEITQQEIKQLEDKIKFLDKRLDDYRLKLITENLLPNQKIVLVIDIFEHCFPHIWLLFWRNHINHFMQQYLNMHLQILLLIDEFYLANANNDNNPKPKFESKYARIYTSQLTNYEMKFLFWCAHHGDEKNADLKRLLDKFSILDNLPKPNEESHYYHYSLHK